MPVVVFAVGLVIVIATVLSAVRTIVVPHGQSANLTRFVFVAFRRVFSAHRLLWFRSDSRRYEVESMYAPVTLVLLPLVWLTGALAGFSAMYWALGVRPVRTAIDVAGSTMLTLEASGFTDWPRMILSFIASALTVSFFALLLITYLPAMYQAYASREQQLIALETVAGSPPDPADLILRLHRIGGLDQLDEVFGEWKHWFFEARETHTALPAVVLFRSARSQRRWVPSVAALLDSAALVNSVRRDDEESPAASLCIRAGSLTLNDIADYFRLDVDRDPDPHDPISVDRSVFEEYYARLDDEGLCNRSLDEAWTAWAGWRVNYDQAVVGLREQTGRL